MELFETLFSSILDQFKKPFSTIRGVLVGGLAYGLYWIGNSTPEGAGRILAACQDTEAALRDYKVGLATFLLTFIAFLLIARHSDSKFRLKGKVMFPDFENYESEACRPIQTHIVESYREGERNRFIKIENNLPHDIDYLKGYVVFGRNCTTTFTVPFEVKVPIRASYGHQIMNGPVTSETYGWTTFSTYIEEISADGRTEEGLYLYGDHIRRTRLNFLLTHYNYLYWLPFLGRYELSWLLQLWKRRIFPWLRYFPMRPRAYEFFLPPLKDEIARTALPEYAALLVRRPRSLSLEPVTAITCEILSLNYCVYSSLLTAAWQSRTRVGERLVVYARRKINQLIWLTVVGATGGVLAFGFGSLFQFIWQLALLWGGVLKYGILVALKLQ